MRLVITCMDYRLSEEVLRRVGPGDLVVRTAGANVRGVARSLAGLPVQEVLYLPHTDCAALKLVYSALSQGQPADPLVEEALVSQYRGRRPADLEELERLHVETQVAILRTLFPHARITVETIDVSKIRWPPRKPVYHLLKPQSRYTQDMIGAYIIQAFRREDVQPDIKVAQTLGLAPGVAEL
ncbi:carbonic anhydrase [Pyrobaculum neutrophilum]|uniref:Carbonic anhydrase n=1 Tax=Pyrobaculum neutrophilum (strain DSM 2338 / JCM 9278 / NBRC 100436 / V24Sta) TaxID=444157 RepID=B1YBT2_PYRNV|nr:carbonic anhydrase [Pyrobaculum neutrophilum]ACB39316.1 carbonic anhydrase [Pyrobaculum neutrophilum V24Sta]